MAAYNLAVIQGYLAIVDNPASNAAKGKAFEDLACYLLSGIPGIKITARNEINSEQVSWFLTKIRHRGVRFGILIAANGITGEPEHLSRANFLVGVEMATFGIKMVIVTREEIETLTSGEDFAQLIIQKVCTLHASGGRCY